MAGISVANPSTSNDDCPAQTDVALSDRQLLKRFVRAGDEVAFEQLIRRHEQLVLGVCRRQLRHEQDVEDAFQATFLVLAAKAGAPGWRASIGNWLYGVALRVARQAQRRRWRRREREFADMESLADETLCRVADQHSLEVLDEELSRLPAKYRAPLVLCYLEGKTRRQAANELGVSEPVVKGRLERGRNRLRTRLLVRGVSLSLAIGALAASQASAATVGGGSAAVAGSSLVAATVAAATSYGQQAVGVSVASSVLSLANGELTMKSSMVVRGGLLCLSLAVLAVCLASYRGESASNLTTAPPSLVMGQRDGGGRIGEAFFVAAGGMPTEQQVLARLRGSWQVESAMDGGRRLTLDETDDVTFVFYGGRLYFVDNKKLKRSRISLDPSATPMAAVVRFEAPRRGARRRHSTATAWNAVSGSAITDGS